MNRPFRRLVTVVGTLSVLGGAPIAAQRPAQFKVTPIPVALQPRTLATFPSTSAEPGLIKSSNRAVTGAIIGGVIGAIVGGFVLHGMCTHDDHTSCLGPTVGGAVAGAVVFGTIGGLIAGI